MPGVAPFDLNGKVVVVTGAGGGFGRTFARGIAAQGAAVACLDHNHMALAETVDLIRRNGGIVDAEVVDIGDEALVDAEFERVTARFGHVDVLVNNAGISTQPTRIHELQSADWDRLMSVNLRGTYLCSKAVLPVMMRQNGGSIINIASITGMRGVYPGRSALNAAYSASKAGMIGFTRQLAAEYAADNIRCNAIAPGFHNGTDLGRERRASASAEETRLLGDTIVNRTPLRRLGTPSDLLGLVLYLASDMSRFVTGQIIAHDGGWTAV